MYFNTDQALWNNYPLPDGEAIELKRGLLIRHKHGCIANFGSDEAAKEVLLKAGFVPENKDSLWFRAEKYRALVEFEIDPSEYKDIEHSSNGVKQLVTRMMIGEADIPEDFKIQVVRK